MENIPAHRDLFQFIEGIVTDGKGQKLNSLQPVSSNVVSKFVAMMKEFIK